MIRDVVAHPCSKQPRVEERDETIHVYCKAAPQDNKANEEVTSLLKKKYNAEVKLLKGKTHKRKRFKIVDGN